MKSRVLAASGTAAVLLGALAVQQMLPASATVPTSSAPVFVAPESLVQGVVVDQSGKPVDDVKVKAVDADGDVVGSALTYASEREDGSQHGYFFVPAPRGTYTVTLSKAGYKTVSYDAGTITRRVKKLSLGELEIKKVAAPTTTSAALVKASVTTKENAAVTVTVKGDGTILGDVEVREKSTVVGSATIGKAAKGKVTVTVKRLPKGTHTLTAYFLGTGDHKASSSKAVTLRVVKKKR